MAVSSLSLSLSKVSDTVGLVLAEISLMQHLPPLVAGLCLLLAERLSSEVICNLSADSRSAHQLRGVCLLLSDSVQAMIS